MSSTFRTSQGLEIGPSTGLGGRLYLRREGTMEGYISLSAEECLEAGAWLLAHGRRELKKQRDREIQELQEELESLRQDAGL